MSKNSAITLALALALSAGAQGVPFEWDAEASVALAAAKDVYRGETVSLRPDWLNYGDAAETNSWTFTLCWQTNGMGSAWWTDTTNAFLWTPSRDCGASRYTLFIRAASSNGVSYRANAIFKMLASPGFVPATLPPPTFYPGLAEALVPFLLPYYLPTATAWTNEADARAAGDLDGSNNVAAAVRPLNSRTNAWDAAASWGDHAGLYRLISWVPAWSDVTGKPAEFAPSAHNQSWSTITNPPPSIATALQPADIAGLASTQQVDAHRSEAVWSDSAHFVRAEGGTNWVGYEISVSGTNLTISGTFGIIDGESISLTNSAFPFNAGNFYGNWQDPYNCVFYTGLSIWINDAVNYPVTLACTRPDIAYGEAVVSIGSYVLATNEVFRSPVAGLATTQSVAGVQAQIPGIATNAAIAVVASATNAVIQNYLLTSNAWITADFTNQTMSVSMVSTNGTTNTVLVGGNNSIDPAATNLLWLALAQANAVIAGKADKAWGQYAPDGGANPDPAYMTFLNAPATLFASGCAWSTYGTYAVLTAPGTVAFESGSNGVFRIGPDSTNYFGYATGGSVTVGAEPDTINVINGGATNGYAEIDYLYEGGDFPTLWFTPSLAIDFTELPSAVWVDNLDGSATVTAPAESAGGYFKATTSATFSSIFEATMPARLKGGVIGATNDLPVVFDSTIEISSGGHTYRLPAQLKN